MARDRRHLERQITRMVVTLFESPNLKKGGVVGPGEP